jgi:hypothetical protein
MPYFPPGIFLRSTSLPPSGWSNAS